MASVPPSRHRIDWKLLAEADDFYSKHLKSVYAETPWIVSEDSALITTTSVEVQSSFGRLVGSAEQGFLHMCRNGYNLPPRCYHSISPCFRDDEIDDLHHKHFMKLEIFETADISAVRLMHIIDTALQFFRGNGLVCDVEMVDENQYDIISHTHKVEVGSYGIRHYQGLRWIYATGLALPRFSRAKELQWLFFDKG